MQRPLPPAPIGDFPDFGIRLTPAPDVWEWLQAEILAGGYVYMQPTANVVTTNLAVGEVIEMVSAVDIVGSLRGIPAWEAELIITKPFSGTSTRSNVHRHLNRTKRQACDRVGNRVVERRAAYLRGYGALFNGERQHSTIQALPWLAGWLFVFILACAGEWVDRRDDMASFGYWRWQASAHDVLNTLFWPTVLTLLGLLCTDKR